jgi:hypothetical protein
MNKKQKKVIKSDGNDFQYKVKKMLSDAEWNARMSPYYNDSFSAKPREIDIIAEKPFLSISESLYQGTVIVRLFIECKYIAEPTTFWFENRNLDKAKKVVDSMRVFHEVDKNSYVADKHHYLSDSLIAKLYKTEGKNFDGDPIYKAMTQCLNATIYYRDHPTDLMKNYNHQAVKELNYSVIICNSFEKFLKKDTVANSAAYPITESFQLEVDYAYTAKDVQLEELFYIDILNIDNFEDFEKKILIEEVGLVRQKMSDDQRQA